MQFKNIKENTGLITFEQLKQACIETYKDYLEQYDEEDLCREDNEISEAKSIDDLVNILDGLGFNRGEAYDFIFGAILK